MVFLTACSNNWISSPVLIGSSGSPTAVQNVDSTSVVIPTKVITPSPKPDATQLPAQITAAPAQDDILGKNCQEITGEGAYAPVRPPEGCVYDYNFPLQRPIELPGRNTVDVIYRYGSTQNGQREPHHGVEFINKAGIPVLAAADGRVVVAGLDEETVFADKTNFYGKLVVIQHELPGIDSKIYTLYGHLLNINVVVGQELQAGKKVGEVGLGGVAAGTHLHFEVRYGLNEYASTRNPELWLQPVELIESHKSGVLAGRFIDRNGESQTIDHIVLEQIEPDEQDKSQTLYLKPYEDPKMIGQLPWKESFGAGDLPPGRYRFGFIYKRPVEFTLDILPGKLTFLTIWIN